MQCISTEAEHLSDLTDNSAVNELVDNSAVNGLVDNNTVNELVDNNTVNDITERQHMDNYAILLATYNGAEYIEEMLDSVDKQTRGDFTVYIHDDGSTDNTMDIVRNHIKDKSNYKIMEFKSKPGAKYNFMEMLRRVDAKYYMFADQDDVWFEDKVEKLILKMSEAERDGEDVPLLVHHDMMVVDDNLNAISASFIRYLGRDINRNSLNQLLIDNTAAGTTMLINRALRDKAILINNVDDVPMHDHWLMCVAAATGKIYVIDEPLIFYRQHESNVMGADTESKVGKVLRNAKDIVTGEFARNKRKFHDTEINLARQLMYVPGVDIKTRKFLVDLINIRDRSKYKRIKFYRDNGLDRNENSIWMRLWV